MPGCRLPWCVLAVLAVSGCTEKQVEEPPASKGFAAERQDNWLELKASEQDVANAYLSALMLEAHVIPGEKGEVECSGVLIGPRLVLTTGQCLCRGSNCASDVNVTAMVYGPRDDDEGSASYDNTLQSGRVRPSHEGLALISVRPMKAIAPLPLATIGATPGEAVTVVGYAHDSVRGGAFRMRHLVHGKVARAGAEGTGDIFLDPAVHAQLVPSDLGGPCVRDLAQGPVLVGILTESSPQRVVCTGFDSRRAWLLEELQRTASAAPAPSPSTP